MSLLNKKIRLIREEPERKRDKEQTHRETDVRPLIVVSPRLKKQHSKHSIHFCSVPTRVSGLTDRDESQKEETHETSPTERSDTTVSTKLVAETLQQSLYYNQVPSTTGSLRRNVHHH